MSDPPGLGQQGGGGSWTLGGEAGLDALLLQGRGSGVESVGEARRPLPEGQRQPLGLASALASAL